MMVPAIPLLALPEDRKTLREAMGITIAEAASELGVSARTYIRWERGDVNPRPANHRKYRQQLRNWQDAIEEYL